MAWCDGNVLVELAQALYALETRSDGGWAGVSGDGLFAFDAAGVELWNVELAPIDDLAIDGADNVVAVGTRAVAKYTPDGMELWSSTFDHAESSVGYRVAIGPDDSIAVVGSISNVDIGRGLDIWVRKYAP
jgi:hypothetical protein